jgi:hypothetical protein
LTGGDEPAEAPTNNGGSTTVPSTGGGESATAPTNNGVSTTLYSTGGDGSATLNGPDNPSGDDYDAGGWSTQPASGSDPIYGGGSADPPVVQDATINTGLGDGDPADSGDGGTVDYTNNPSNGDSDTYVTSTGGLTGISGGDPGVDLSATNLGLTTTDYNANNILDSFNIHATNALYQNYKISPELFTKYTVNKMNVVGGSGNEGISYTLP